MTWRETDGPKIMGIVNVTPDSHYAHSRCPTAELVLSRVEAMLEAGADIIDLGAESTAPQNPALVLTEDDELQRLVPVLDALQKHFPEAAYSVDTSRPRVMQEAVAHGVSLINDVRALRREGALEMAAGLNVPVCLMHMLHVDGTAGVANPYPSNDTPWFEDIVSFLKTRKAACLAAGISEENIWLDPGFGYGSFGKTRVQNLELMRRLPELSALNSPLLVSVSRKTFVREVMQQAVEDCEIAGVALAVMAVEKGAHIIRTHDVKATQEALTMWQAVQQGLAYDH